MSGDPAMDLSLSAWRDVDEICDRFESACRTGERLRVEQFLQPVEGSARVRLLRELILLEIEYRRIAGESPAQAEYTARFPNDPDAVRQAFESSLVRTVVPSDPLDAVFDTIQSGESRPDFDNETSKSDTPKNETGANEASEEITWVPEIQQTRTGPGESSATSRDLDGLPPGLQDHQRYRIVRCLARGGMGDVYLAEHRLMGRAVVLKTIRLDAVNNPALAERFQREVRASAKLNHPNVVAVFDAEHSADTLFLAMEYLQGDDLFSLIRARGRLNVPTACALLYQATAGVKHAHERGVIHRDIKPNNLFLVQCGDSVARGLVKVLDFGLAKVLQDAGVYQYGTPTGFAMGTVGYMAPEQAANARSVGIHADIFSLGRTLYYLLSGELPYRHGIQSLMKEESGENPVVPLDQLCSNLPGEVVGLVEKMTARSSEDRFRSCAEVMAALAPLCGA